MTGIIEKIFGKDLSEQVNISFPGLGIGDFSVKIYVLDYFHGGVLRFSFFGNSYSVF